MAVFHVLQYMFLKMSQLSALEGIILEHILVSGAGLAPEPTDF